jgi:hypothetical protein
VLGEFLARCVGTRSEGASFFRCNIEGRAFGECSRGGYDRSDGAAWARAEDGLTFPTLARCAVVPPRTAKLLLAQSG